MGIAVSSERGTRPTQDAPSPKIIPEYTHGRRDRAPRTDKVRAFPPRDPFFSRLSFFFFYLRPLLLLSLYAARPVIFMRSISRHSELARDKLIARGSLPIARSSLGRLAVTISPSCLVSVSLLGDLRGIFQAGSPR